MDKKLTKILKILQMQKYKNVKVYDVEESGVSKFLVVATAINILENKKSASVISQELKFEGNIDGFHKGEWIIFDFDEIVLHLFASGFREKFNIDKLYKGKEVLIESEEKKNKQEIKKKNKV